MWISLDYRLDKDSLEGRGRARQSVTPDLEYELRVRGGRRGNFNIGQGSNRRPDLFLVFSTCRSPGPSHHRRAVHNYGQATLDGTTILPLSPPSRHHPFG